MRLSINIDCTDRKPACKGYVAIFQKFNFCLTPKFVSPFFHLSYSHQRDTQEALTIAFRILKCPSHTDACQLYKHKFSSFDLERLSVSRVVVREDCFYTEKTFIESGKIHWPQPMQTQTQLNLRVQREYTKERIARARVILNEKALSQLQYTALGRNRLVQR